ncbi:hypothetical protein EBX31_07060 [bacterium]|nr:hypothetical protein [bacterium]
MSTTTQPTCVIEPCSDNPGSHKTGELRNITAEEITAILGFEPNFPDDPAKVVNSWLGRITFSDGERKMFAIWDWKGSHLVNRYSTWGDRDVLNAMFHGHYSDGLSW